MGWAHPGGVPQRACELTRIEPTDDPNVQASATSVRCTDYERYSNLLEPLGIQ